ncbi:MAG: hypothetical protein C4326_08435 [Ignavibacteria bacterium]
MGKFLCTHKVEVLRGKINDGSTQEVSLDDALHIIREGILPPHRYRVEDAFFFLRDDYRSRSCTFPIADATAS